MLRNVICFLVGLCIISCQEIDDVFFIPVPDHFPLLPVSLDSSPTLEKIALGKRLFFDTRLSIDSTLSCASCHLPEFAFSDTLAVSLGVKGIQGKRNAPSLLNSGYGKLFNKDGGVTKLDIFALLPIEDHTEMGIPAVQLINRLSKDSELQKEAKNAFNRDLDPFVITRALASFVRTLISGDSKYDDYLKGTSKLSDAEEKGRQLFFSDKTKCSQCHDGILFTNQKFESNGTKEVYQDQGRKLVTGKETDRGKFKVASLRNVALTGPYMHDGSFSSLESVIDHYNQGGQSNPNKSNLIKPLGLSEKEKQNLIAFLQTLTDKKYLH